MKTQLIFPEVNALNLDGVRAAIHLGNLNLDCLTPIGRAVVLTRLEALRERERRLMATAAARAAVEAALRG